MKLPISTLNCVGFMQPTTIGWVQQPSQREMQVKYNPKKPLSRQIAIAKFQRIALHPKIEDVYVNLAYYNARFAGYNVNENSQPVEVYGLYLNGKVYTQNSTTGYCYMWTVPFNVDIGKNIDVYGAKPNPRNRYTGK